MNNNKTTNMDPNSYTKSDLFKLLMTPTIICIIWYLSPIDLIPDFIPVIGTMDDMIFSIAFMSASFKNQYQNITGVEFDKAALIGKTQTVTVAVEHIITSIVQIFADMGVVTTIFTPLLSAIDLIVLLGVFYATALSQLHRKNIATSQPRQLQQQYKVGTTETTKPIYQKSNQVNTDNVNSMNNINSINEADNMRSLHF